MYSAASDAKKATAAAMSDGWASRLIGTERVIPPITFSASSPELSANLRSAGVSVGPGQTLFTVTPFVATSRASVFVNAMMPPLAPEYTASSDDPTRPASEPMLITRPKPRSTMPGTTACMTRSAPLKLMSRILSQKSSEVFRNGMKSSQPALLTTISMSPSSAATVLTALRTDSVSVTSTWTAIASPPAPAMRFAVASAASRFRSATATRNPLAPKVSEMPWPMPWAPPVTNATRLVMSSLLVMLDLCLGAGCSARVGRPVDRTGNDAVTGQFAAKHALRGAGRIDQGGQRNPGRYAHLLEHADQILRGDVSGGSRRHRAAAEFAEAGFEAGAPGLQRGACVGQSLA